MEQRVSDLEDRADRADARWDAIVQALGGLATKDDLNALATKDDLKDVRDELRGHIGDLQEDVKILKGRSTS